MHFHFVASHLPPPLTEALPVLPLTLFLFIHLPKSPTTTPHRHHYTPPPKLVVLTRNFFSTLSFILLLFYSLHLDLPIYLSSTNNSKQMATRSLEQKHWLWTTALPGPVFCTHARSNKLISGEKCALIRQWQKCINHIAQCRYSHLRLVPW